MRFAYWVRDLYKFDQQLFLCVCCSVWPVQETNGSYSTSGKNGEPVFKNKSTKTGRRLITLHKQFYLSFISLLNSLTNFSCSPSHSERLPALFFFPLLFIFWGSDLFRPLKSRPSPLPLKPKLDICPCNSTLSPLTHPAQPSGPLRLGFCRGGGGHGVR